MEVPLRFINVEASKIYVFFPHYPSLSMACVEQSSTHNSIKKKGKTRKEKKFNDDTVLLRETSVSDVAVFSPSTTLPQAQAATLLYAYI